jgi:hypothetical protein
VPTVRAADAVGPSGSGTIRWLRLLVLASLGIGLASPLLLALVNRRSMHGAVDTARQFLFDLQTSHTERVASLLTPRARGEDNDRADGEPPSAVAMQNAERITQILARLLQPYELTLESPSRQGEFLDVPFMARAVDRGKAASSDARPGATTSAAPRPPTDGGDSDQVARGIVHLRQMGERWRVAGVTLPLMRAASATTGPGVVSRGTVPLPQQFLHKFDFEQLATCSAVLPAQPKTAFDFLRPITPADFVSVWQIDVDVDNRPAEIVLMTLAQEIGRPWNRGPTPQPGRFTLRPGEIGPLPLPGQSPPLPESVRQPMRRPITLHLHKVSRLEAIEAICRQVGLHPEYQANALLLYPGPRRFPATLCGPFLLEATTVSETADEATATLSLTLHTTPMPPNVTALFQSLPLHVSNLQVKGASGEDHFHRRKLISPAEGTGVILRQNYSGAFDAAFTGRGMSTTWNVPLKNLLRDLDTIAELRCSIGLDLVREVQRLHLEPVAAGSYASGSGVRITLRDIESGPSRLPPTPGTSSTQKRFRFQAEGLDGRRLCWQASAGNAAPQFRQAYPSVQGDFSLSPTLSPESFDFKVLSLGDTLTWDCQLRNIPLARPPRRLEPPRHEGHPAPVSVEVEPLQGDRLWMRITNHSQKTIDAVVVKLAYLDADGRAVGQQVRKMPQDAQVAQNAPLLAPASTRARAVLAPWEDWRLSDRVPPPKEARSARASLVRVDFADATSWPP